MSSWQALDVGELEELVGRAGDEVLDRALRRPGWPGRPHPGPCRLQVEAVEWCACQPAGGVALTECCGRPVFVPPDSTAPALDVDDEPADIEATFHASELRGDPLELEPLEPLAGDPPLPPL